MTLESVFKELKAKQVESNSAIITQDDVDMKVTIGISNNLCSILVETQTDVDDVSEKVIQSINKYDNLVRYLLVGGHLSLVTTMWVDKKPTNSALTEIVSLMIAKALSMKRMLEVMYGG